MGQAKRRQIEKASRTPLPQSLIAAAVRRSVVAVAAQHSIAEGLCGFHAAVGQRLLAERFGIKAILVAGDFQRRINDRVVHSYARDGGRIDAAVGACHVWLTEMPVRAVVDFDAWEEPVRYAASGQPYGPWTAARPEFYWTDVNEEASGVVRVVPDQQATDYVQARLRSDANARIVSLALAEAVAILES